MAIPSTTFAASVLVVLFSLTFVVTFSTSVTGTNLVNNLDWPSPAIGWWYTADHNWPLLMEQVAPHKNVVTSVMVFCGPEVADDATITTHIAKACIEENGNGTLPALAAMGIRPELWIGSGNCSIDTFRRLWKD